MTNLRTSSDSCEFPPNISWNFSELSMKFLQTFDENSDEISGTHLIQNRENLIIVRTVISLQTPSSSALKTKIFPWRQESSQWSWWMNAGCPCPRTVRVVVDTWKVRLQTKWKDGSTRKSPPQNSPWKWGFYFAFYFPKMQRFVQRFILSRSWRIQVPLDSVSNFWSITYSKTVQPSARWHVDIDTICTRHTQIYRSSSPTRSLYTITKRERDLSHNQTHSTAVPIACHLTLMFSLQIFYRTTAFDNTLIKRATTKFRWIYRFIFTVSVSNESEWQNQVFM